MLSDHCLSVPGKRISRDGDGDADFGNFHNYYAFNKVSERLDRLQESGCLGQIAHHHLSTGRDRPLTFLDVGCNEGRVTEGFLKALKHHSSVDDPCAVIALGVDIDSELVKRAQRLQAPLPPDQQHFICLNIMSTEQQKELDRFLCGVAQQRFTMVLALSVTMWIHIHHGDVGLKDFLHLLCERSEFLIVEPQPWKCYERWRRAGKELPIAFDSVMFRNDVEQKIQQTIEEKGFFLIKEIGSTKWDRKIVLYSRFDLRQRSLA